MKTKLFISIIAISCACTPARAWNSADITCTKNQYTAALAACRTNCNAPCLSDSITTTCDLSILQQNISICECITAGYSADNCAALIKAICKDDTEAATTIGTTELWYERTYNSGANTCTSTQKTYCAAGYYGTATGINAGCNTCPSNATCPGGLEQANVYCNQGYIAITTSTVGAGCRTCGTTGAYTNKELTTAATATTAGLTLLTAATSAACYLPAGTYYDSTGQFTISTDQACYY